MYRAPLKDLNFVLEQVLGTGSLSGQKGFEEYSTELAASVLQEAARFAENVLDPLYKSGDREGARWTPEGVVTPKDSRQPICSSQPTAGPRCVPIRPTAVRAYLRC
jgi:hypothetical protein